MRFLFKYYLNLLNHNNTSIDAGKAQITDSRSLLTFFVLFIGAIIIPIFMTISHFFSVSAGNEFVSSLDSVVLFTLSFLLVIFGAMMINSLFI